MTQSRGRLWKPVLLAGVAAMAVASVGASFTDLGPWYQALKSPPWKPPDWLFGPAWTLIFGLIALSAAIAWREAPCRGRREWLIGLFALNGTLNVVWSLLYFRMQRPDWAMVDVVLLWLSIVVLIVATARSSKLASWLLVPYLAWVTFAGALNWAIIQLNGPFG